jgi:hypothetical protein
LDETVVKSVRRAAARPRRGPTLLERSRALITGRDLPFARVKEDRGKVIKNVGYTFLTDGGHDDPASSGRKGYRWMANPWRS